MRIYNIFIFCLILIAGFLFAESALAAPVMTGAEYFDRDGNGTIDIIETIWSEPVIMPKRSDNAWAVEGGSLNLRVTFPTTDTTFTNRIEVLVAADPGETSHGIPPTIRYLSDDNIENELGQKASPSSTITIEDKAGPVMTGLRVADLDHDGNVNRVRITFSETVDIIDGGLDTMISLETSSRQLTLVSKNYGATAVQQMEVDINNSAGVSPSTSLRAIYYRDQPGSIVDQVGNEVPERMSVRGTAPGLISPANFAFSNMKAGAINNATVTFKPPSSIPNSGQILFIFPEGFNLTTVGSVSCPTLSGSIIRTVEQRTVRLKRFGGSQAASTQQSCVISGVTNPTFGARTGVYKIYITDSDEYMLSQNTAIQGTIFETEPEPTPTPPPPPSPTPEPTPTPEPAPEPTPTPEPTGEYIDPSQEQLILDTLGQTRDLVCESDARTRLTSDMTEFDVTLNSTDLDRAITYTCYGISTETLRLGSGERRAMLRDYFDVLRTNEIRWDDIQRMATGQKIVHRQLERERTLVDEVLRRFRLIYGHDPIFTNSEEDLAWNTLMYRIRFSRDLVAERGGIVSFSGLNSRTPSTPLDWAVVRLFSYVRQ